MDNLYIFDFEVFRYDWLVVFKQAKPGEFTVIHNDSDALKEFMKGDKLLCGFNNKHYDNHVLKSILCGADNAMVKARNRKVKTMKKTIKMLIDRILDLLCLWLGLDCPARRADVDAGICDYSGQGRDTYGK